MSDLRIRVAFDSDTLALGCIVEEVVEEDGLLLDLIELALSLRAIVGSFLRFLSGEIE
jgi:hypothetical protein